MLTLDDLLHPITPEQFRAEYKDRRPLHIPAVAGSARRDALTWAAFNALLNQDGVWDSERLRVMRDGVPVPAIQYCSLKQTPAGPVMRPWPPKVEVFLSAGAGVVANDVMALHPPLARIGAVLAEAFAGEIGVNAFCSFTGVPAFGTHFDLHDVFAIQTEGEKIWNIYPARADNPLEYPGVTPQEVARVRAEGAMQVHMRPGDLLYLPRGVYHDALAKDGPSLHVTCSVTQLTGRSTLALLDRLAMQHPAFRAWLPPSWDGDGGGLRTALADLGRLYAEIAASPDFADEVALMQRRLVPRVPDFTLPARKPITLYRTTGLAFPPAGKGLRLVYDWMIDQRQFAVEDMVAHFDIIAVADIMAGLVAAEQAGALRRS